MKKLVSLMLVVVLLVVAAVPAFAADHPTADDTGSITIRNSTPGNTYRAYKLFDLIYEEKPDGTYGVGYSIDSKVNTYLFSELKKDTSPFEVKQVGSTDVYNVVRKEGTGAPTDADIIEWVKGLNRANLSTAEANKKSLTAATSAAKFTGLDLGYWIVDTSASDCIISLDSMLPDAIVADKNPIPDWDNEPGPSSSPGPRPSGAPGQDPNPGKVILEKDENDNTIKVTENTANYGETVSFSIAINAVSYVKESAANDVNPSRKPETGDELAHLVTYYYIHDELDPGFVPTGTNGTDDIVVKIYKMNENGTYSSDATTLERVTGTTPGAGKYSITKSTDANGKNIFDITVPFGEQYGAKAKIEVTYSAKLHEDGDKVVLAGDGNFNKANFTYDTYKIDPNQAKDPNDPTATPSPDDPIIPGNTNYPSPKPSPTYNSGNQRDTQTYTYAVALQKIDTFGNPLPGAVFQLLDSSNNAIKAKPAKDASGNAVPGVYDFDSTNGGTDFETDANGVLVIQGLESGPDYASPDVNYYFKEIKAPAGFNLLTTTAGVTVHFTDPQTNPGITVHFDENGQVTGDESKYADAKYAPKTYPTAGTVPSTVSAFVGIPVVNSMGPELPATGGIGTTIFYVLGSVLMVGAVILLITKKRMSVKD